MTGTLRVAEMRNVTTDGRARFGYRAIGRATLVALAVASLGACVAKSPEPPPPEPVEAAPVEPVVFVPPEIDSALGSYLAGRLARHESDGEEAARYFMRALDDDPENADLLNDAFLATHGEGRMAEAVKLARRLVDIKPGASVAGLTLAVDAMGRGNLDEAERRLETLPRQGYNTLLVPLMSAWVAAGKNRFDVADEALEALGTNEAFAVFHDFHGALINDIAGNDEAAERSYLAAIDSQPRGSYRTVAALGVFQERSGRAEEALALYEDYQADNPDSLWFERAVARAAAEQPAERLVRDARDGAAEALFGVASALLQENAVEAAIVYARLAVYLRPDFDAGNMLLGETLESLGQPEAASAAFRQIPRGSPLAWTVRLKIASNLDDLDRNDESVALLRELAADRPDRSDALITLGDLLRGKERWLESIAAYDEAFARIGAPERRHWRPLYARGIALERSRQWSRAEDDFLTALDLVPNQPFVLNYLGYSWVDQGVNLERALDMIEQAVDLRPNDGYIIDSLGWAHYRMGNFEDAVVHLERATELHPGDSTINDHLGDALWRVGRRLEARFQWRRALALEPEEEGAAATIREKLEHGLLPSPVADGAS